MLPKAVANRCELSRRWSYQPWEIITNFVASNFNLVIMNSNLVKLAEFVQLSDFPQPLELF